MRALVDNGTYAIGHRDVDPATGKFVDRGIVTEDGWRTIDKVLQPETHDFYSSKPPLLATLATLNIFRFRSVRPYWPTLPIVWLAKIAWCLGAAAHP